MNQHNASQYRQYASDENERITKAKRVVFRHVCNYIFMWTKKGGVGRPVRKEKSYKYFNKQKRLIQFYFHSYFNNSKFEVIYCILICRISSLRTARCKVRSNPYLLQDVDCFVAFSRNKKKYQKIIHLNYIKKKSIA
jgi:hypothetical protein